MSIVANLLKTMIVLLNMTIWFSQQWELVWWQNAYLLTRVIRYTGCHIHSWSWLVISRTDHTTFHDSSPAGFPNTLLWDVLWCSDRQRNVIWNVHDLGTHSLKQASLEGFSKKISQHLCCWTILNSNFTLTHSICDEKITNIQVSCSFSTRCLSIVLQ